MTAAQPSRLQFGAFVMNTGSHMQHGLWRHPDAKQHTFDDVNLWVDLAKTLERGRFDTIFFADVVGVYGGAGASFDVNAREGMQLPSNDPSMLLSALAISTEHLGLAFTSSILQEHPFTFARKISTIDHASGGRVGWNIVTSFLENAARNYGLDRLVEHDERYAWAEEYVAVVGKLWEGSWDDGAFLADKASGVFADPTKVHRIDHVGERYRVEGPHLSSPSPQRSPLLFQAGSSGAGKAFAANYAEVQFMMAPSIEAARASAESTRALVAETGRDPRDVKFWQAMSFIVGSTEEEAKRIEAEYDEYLSADAFLAHSNLGTDQATGKPIDPDTPLKDVETQGGHSMLEALKALSPDREPTVRDLAKLTAKLRGRVVGTPEQIADHLAEWRAAGIDGINVANWMIPHSYEVFVDEVIPVLQERGLAQREYAPGTLREKLFGVEPTLPETHPLRAYRGAFAGR